MFVWTIGDVSTLIPVFMCTYILETDVMRLQVTHKVEKSVCGLRRHRWLGTLYLVANIEVQLMLRNNYYILLIDTTWW